MSKPDRRPDILAAIRALSTRDADGLVSSPTYEEIAAHIGLSSNSKGLVCVMVKAMIAEGLLIRSRAIDGGGTGGRDLVVVEIGDRRLDALVADVLDWVVKEQETPADLRNRLAEVLARVG